MPITTDSSQSIYAFAGWVSVFSIFCMLSIYFLLPCESRHLFDLGFPARLCAGLNRVYLLPIEILGACNTMLCFHASTMDYVEYSVFAAAFHETNP